VATCHAVTGRPGWHSSRDQLADFSNATLIVLRRAAAGFLVERARRSGECRSRIFAEGRRSEALQPVFDLPDRWICPGRNAIDSDEASRGLVESLFGFALARLVGHGASGSAADHSGSIGPGDRPRVRQSRLQNLPSTTSPRIARPDGLRMTNEAPQHWHVRARRARAFSPRVRSESFLPHPALQVRVRRSSLAKAAPQITQSRPTRVRGATNRAIFRHSGEHNSGGFPRPEITTTKGERQVLQVRERK
jgi:hypothetical protein